MHAPWTGAPTVVAPLLVASLLGLLACEGSSSAPSASTAPTSSASAATSRPDVAAAPPSSARDERAPRPRHSGPVKPHPSAQAVVEHSTPIAAHDALAATPETVGLPRVAPGSPGPIVVEGYPAPLEAGMRDYAMRVGYAADGSAVIACGVSSPAGESCFVHDGAATRKLAMEWDGADDPVLLKQLAEGDMQTLARNEAKMTVAPPSVGGTWAHAGDVTLAVSVVPAGEGSGAIRLGGRYAKEAPVFSVTLSVAPKSAAPLPYEPAVNAILTSPKGDEIAVVGHFFCMEWCNEIAFARVGLGAMASHVYNDTGFRHHRKKAYQASRDLFLKATWANPRAPRPPFNLACAYSLLGDAANAEKALKLAIAVGGPDTKTRAKKDADFASVASAPWFRALTD
jgi:hypothetical protein